MIVCQNLYVTYRWRQEPVLKGVNGTFRGKSLILGPNGSGKTTLFRAICGLTNIKSGKILIDEKPIEEIYATKGVVSANFQDIYTLIDAKAFDLIRLYTDLAEGDPQLALKIIEDFGITPDFLKKRKLGELSSGQAKIFCTALALAMKARHVLLDEPFEELDPARKGRMVNYLNEYEGVVLINTHETWLLKNLQDWEAFLMFEGILYGPLTVKDLLNARISMAEEPDSLLRLSLSGKTVSIIKGKGKGKLLTSLENLDKMYEIAEGLKT
ncbi:MAG: ATP-binding cassette domain-containing protein [Candidatus Bathyarchaeia archaeon]